MRRERCAVLIALAALAATVSRKSAAQRVEVQTWQPPRTGWLYVIDATSGESRIFLFAPELGEVRGTLHVGHNLDISLSPRGDRLYLASDFYGCGQPNCDRLAVIDTQAGRVLSTTPIPDRVLSHVVEDGGVSRRPNGVPDEMDRAAERGHASRAGGLRHGS
jgi:hypothetical protein